MSKTFNFAVTAVLGSFLSLSAEAVPIAPLDSELNSDVSLVAGGCGAGFHPGPYGHCRPNAVVVAPAVVAPVGPVVVVPGRICPLGMHLGPYHRHCIPN